MSRGRNRKKQKEARLVSDQKEAAQKGITVAELRQQRKDKNTAIVVGIASLIPAFRGAKLATKGVTSGYKFLKGLFKSKPRKGFTSSNDLIKFSLQKKAAFIL